ncbi:phosphodiester glycosidase family protein [Paenibacillus sp. UNC451MF]|uniref:phosphodiester glycosidase family protein n=1 Tax=Paenibacillus sp. UNC451MF TaxID=1449063 RepID=UPI00048BF1DC|nr:phosphodiester glycosidase family protein [Paenibacillus sp. UNC451MF]
MSQSTRMEQDEQLAWQLFKSEEERIAVGVKYLHHQMNKGDLTNRIHMVEVDPTHELVHLEPVSSQGKVIRLETVGNLLHELELQGKKCVAGFNGDFFSYVGVPSGLQLVEGEIITSPQTTKVMLAVMQDGTVRLEHSVSMKGILQCENGYIMEVDIINRARTLKYMDHACVYNWRYGRSTRTPNGGIEVTLTTHKSVASLYLGHPIQGTVKSIQETSDSPIDQGTWVLSLTGNKAEQFQKNIALGAIVTLQVEYDRGIQNARQVISGNSTLAYMLLKNGIIPNHLYDTSIRLNSDRHPRTIVATKQGKLYIAAIDGRQPGFSEGMTLAEEASYLQSLGMEDAINLDGGGSTTCYICHPGDEFATLVNQPSDGFEREVGNGLAIISKAPRCELDSLIISPAIVRALAGSKVSFEVKGHDRYWNALTVKPEEVQWSVQGDIGSINERGEWTAGSQTAAGQIIAHYGAIVQSAQVCITNELERLELIPSAAEVEPGGILQFKVKAYDGQGQDIFVSSELLTWSTENEIGRIDPSGQLFAANEGIEGRVRASWGHIKAFASVHVGKPHFIIADFEKLDGLGVAEVNTVQESVTLTKAARPSPVKFGTFSGKWSYDFTGMSGSSRAHITFKDDLGAAGLEIGGKPYRFGLWVNGDGGCHWLRMGFEDADGIKRTLNFTDPGGLNWRGWKYVYVDVPIMTRYPLRVHTLTLVETNDANKTKGVLYLDDFRAEYVDFHEDVEGPEFTDMSPTDQAIISQKHPDIRVTVTDAKSGVDPSSIRVWLNHSVISHTYHADTGLLECKPSNELEAGTYRIVVEAADKARNAALPAATWSFEITV